MSAEERCLICGTIIPEGRQICPACEAQYSGSERHTSQQGAGASFGISVGEFTPAINKPDLRRTERRRRHNNFGKRQR